MTLSDTIQVLANVATATGIGVAAWAYLSDRRRDQYVRRMETQHTVDAVYNDFVRVLLDNPDIPLLASAGLLKGYAPFGDTPEAELLNNRSWLLTCYLFSVLETAFMTFRESPDELTRAQWPGWEQWGLALLRDQNIARVWADWGDHYDERFCEHFNKCLSGEELGDPNSSR